MLATSRGMLSSASWAWSTAVQSAGGGECELCQRPSSYKNNDGILILTSNPDEQSAGIARDNLLGISLHVLVDDGQHTGLDHLVGHLGGGVIAHGYQSK